MNSCGAMLFFLWICLPQDTRAATLEIEGLQTCGTVTAIGALDGARFNTDAGNIVKLALVKAPEIWDKGSPYKDWPHARQSMKALANHVTGREMSLFCEGDKTNRHGEVEAHVVMADGRWLQQLLVSEGQVFVFPRPTRRRGLPALYAAEDQAREHRLGLWALDNLMPIEATSPNIRSGWFHIVEGTVLNAQMAGQTIYLNFGTDWRTDFTVEIPGTAQRHFSKAGLDPLSFGGKRIEVRGWIDFKGGPRLLLQGPGQIREKPVPAP